MRAVSGKTREEKTLSIPGALSNKYVQCLIVPLIFFIDQFSKRLASDFLSDGRSRALLPDVFHLTLVHNTGAAFGLMRGRGLLLVGVTVLALLLFSIYVLSRWDRISRFYRWGLLMVIGGASGNLYDRLAFRYVIDFLDFRVWPVFNLADSFVCIGVSMILLSLFKR